ncbi:MAG: sugar phosphate isomerase/epimerase family protein [Tuberibacillus sp.]
MTKIPVALQMYTLRRESEKDFLGTLEKVAALGYSGVEFAGYGGLDPQVLKNVLSDNGLIPVSSHVPLHLLENELANVIKDLQALGCPHLVCPWLAPEQRTEAFYAKLIDVLNHVGKNCREQGITFSYHHHDFELATLDNGKKPLEWLMAETNPDWVKVEFDVYWLKKAGEDPVDWLRRFKGRAPLIHLKDMTKDDTQFFAELGTGGVDIDSILNQGEPAGVEWWIVEQDECTGSPLDSVAASMEFLKQKGIS